MSSLYNVYVFTPHLWKYKQDLQSSRVQVDPGGQELGEELPFTSFLFPMAMITVVQARMVAVFPMMGRSVELIRHVRL